MPNPTPNQALTPAKEGWLGKLGLVPAAALFLLMISATLVLWGVTKNLVQKEREQKFQKAANSVVDHIDDRLFQYQGTLLSIRGLFNASEEVTRGEWRRYAESIAVETTAPNVGALAYIAVVNRENREEFVDWVRGDATEPEADQTALRDFQILPAGERDQYYVVTFIEPFKANIRAFGYDLRSEPKRQASLELARDTGNITATQKVSNLTNGQPVFSLYVPIYFRDRSIGTVEERRQALQGFVTSAFPVDQFFREGGGDRPEKLDFLVYEDETDNGQRMLLYGSNPEINSLGTIPTRYLKYETLVPVMQRNWRVTFFQPSIPESRSLQDYLPELVLATGSAISFFVFLAIATLSSSILSGVQLAKHMTFQLRSSEEQYRNIFTSLRDLLFHTDLAGKILLINPSAEHYLRQPPTDFIGTQAELLFEQPGKIRELLDRLRKGEPILDEPVVLRQTNNHQQIMSLNAYLLFAETGKPKEIEWVLRNITSRPTTPAGPTGL